MVNPGLGGTVWFLLAIWIADVSFGAYEFCPVLNKRLRLLDHGGLPLLEPLQCGSFVQAPVVLRFNRQPRVEFTFDPPAGNYTLAFASVRNTKHFKLLWKITSFEYSGRDLSKNGTIIKSYEPPDLNLPGIYRFVFWVSDDDDDSTGETVALPKPDNPPVAAFEFHYQMGTILIKPTPVWPKIVVPINDKNKWVWDKEKGKWVRSDTSILRPHSLLLFVLTAAAIAAASVRTTIDLS